MEPLAPEDVQFRHRNLRYSNWNHSGSPMTTNESSSEKPGTEEAPKKTYEKPSFRFEQVFVTTALSCGKIGGTSFSCRHNHKVS